MSLSPIPKVPPNPFMRAQVPPINEAIAAINDQRSIVGVGTANVGQLPGGVVVSGANPTPTEFWFYGFLVRAGPNGEADFTDARYWVQSLSLVQAAQAASVDKTLPYMDNYTYAAQLVSGTYLPDAALGIHSLPTWPASAVNISNPLGNQPFIVRARFISANKISGSINDPANTVCIIEPLKTPAFFPVFVRNVGGSNGADGTAYATWTYDVFSDSDLTNKIGSARGVGCGRCRSIQTGVTVANTGDVGSAYYDFAGNVKLFDVPEVYEQAECADSESDSPAFGF